MGVDTGANTAAPSPPSRCWRLLTVFIFSGPLAIASYLAVHLLHVPSLLRFLPAGSCSEKGQPWVSPVVK